MKTFDFEKAKEFNFPAKLEWLKENWDKEVSIIRYINVMTNLYGIENRSLHPSARRHEYKHLRDKYGFFNGKHLINN
jgi:hypothetical protein